MKRPPVKTKEVVFLANGKPYAVKYGTTKDLYSASDEIFATPATGIISAEVIKDNNINTCLQLATF